MPTWTALRRPPYVGFASSESMAMSSPGATETSSRRRSFWLGLSPSTASKEAIAIGTRSGWATQEPSKPSFASRSLSALTFSKATRLASASLRDGMKAAMPPMACAPRLWQVLTRSSVYARMNGAVIVTALRSGRTNFSPPSRKFFTMENR